jgi:hypothetical protein
MTEGFNHQGQFEKGYYKLTRLFFLMPKPTNHTSKRGKNLVLLLDRGLPLLNPI